MNILKTKGSTRGFLALTTVLIISAVMSAVLLTTTFLSIGEGQSSLSVNLGENNLNLVEGCVEDALSRAKLDVTFGNSITSFTRPEGTCSITPAITKVGTTWTMVMTTSATDNMRKIQVIFTRTPTQVSITGTNNWQEI